MASKKRLAGAALAESRVLKKQLPDSPTPTYSLAVNPGFAEPNTPDETRGVTYPGASENIQAEQGLARHVMKQLQPANLESWIRGQIARKGGAANVARNLLAMNTPNASKAQYRAQLRKVEEWRQGKYKKAAGGNAARVGLLRLAESRHIVAHVRGWWRFGDGVKYPDRYTNFKTRPNRIDEVEAIRDAIKLDGATFISTVTASAENQLEHESAAPELLKTHELRLEVKV